MNSLEALLNGKVVLVTGGSRGLGAEISKTFAAHGAKIALIFLSRTQESRKTLEEIWPANGQAIGFQTDVRDYAQVVSMVQKVEAQFGTPVDILVITAYPGGVHGNVQGDWVQFENSFSTFVRGAANSTNAVLPIMVAREKGRIINVGSFTLWFARNNAHYTTAKGALLALTRSIAYYYGTFSITTNTVSLGPIWRDSRSPQPLGQDSSIHSQLSPLRRLPTAEEVANVLTCTVCSSDLNSAG